MKLINSIPQKLLYQYEAKSEWMGHDSYFHGPAHMMRVFILQELICDQLESQGITVNRAATRWATSVHDIGRIDDGLDLEHGRRSAEWMNANIPSGLSPETIDIATYIVHWHVPSDDQAPVMTTELKVMKDADGLDRVRLGDLNQSYLRTDAARGLVELAQKLSDASMPRTPHEKESFQTVINAALKLGLVKN